LEKRLINPRTVRNCMTFVIALIASLIVLFTTSHFSNRLVQDIQNKYSESTDLVVTGYTNSVTLLLDSFNATLKAIYDDELFTTGTSEQIQKYLNVNSYKTPREFLDFFYFDKKGIAYSMDGSIHGIKDRSYYEETFIHKKEYFVSEATNSRYDGSDVFIMTNTVYDKDGNIKGGLAGAIRLTSLKTLFKEAHVLESGNISLIDIDGRYLVHENENLILKTYVPRDKQYLNGSSTELSMKKNGNMISQDENGKLVNLVFRSVPKCNWVLCLALPLESIVQLQKQQRLIRLIMTMICIGVICFLMLFEVRLIEYFQKKEFLYTDYDSITKLWTKEKFEDVADKMLHKRGKNKYMLVECDIEGFKFVNQTYGEVEANRLLKFFSKLVEKSTKQFNGICGRGFADHFYCLFKIESVRASMKDFDAFIKNNSTVVENYKIPFNIKYGIAFALPGDRYKGLTTHGLIGQASLAKTEKKDWNEVPYAIYDSKMLKKIQNEKYLELQSEKALENREFFVMYQPKIDLKDEKIVGAEALVRWQHPEKGIIPPNDFIPLFERNGFVSRIDFFVLEEALRFLDSRIKSGLPLIKISVNMSRNHNKPEKFMQEFMTIFNKYSVPAKYIQIEIIERSFSGSDNFIEITDRLHKEGFTVAMDDFGSGESSLNMLTKVPIDVIKFDRGFLLSSTNKQGEIERRSAGFIESLINLSKHLEKETVFEGVETEAQRDFLRIIDCDQVQGYFYSRPLIEKDFVTYINNHS